MEPRRGVVWVNGELTMPEHARVSVWDHGLTVGDGIFETMKVVQSQAFALGRHLRRLRRSAEGLGLELDRSDDELRAAVNTTIAANERDMRVGRLRLTVTGGLGPLGSNRGDGRPTVLIATSELVPRLSTCALVIVPWRRNEHSAVAGLKTTSYAENVVALAYAVERGGDEAVFANTAGNLCEGTGTNIFVALDGRLVTPPLTSGCLAGVTRELVIETMPVDEEDLPLEALAGADEAFVTSSTRDVQAVSTVDGVALPFCPGPLTEAAAQAFADIEATSLDP